MQPNSIHWTAWNRRHAVVGYVPNDGRLKRVYYARIVHVFRVADKIAHTEELKWFSGVGALGAHSSLPDKYTFLLCDLSATCPQNPWYICHVIRAATSTSRTKESYEQSVHHYILNFLLTETLCNALYYADQLSTGLLG